MRGRYFKNSHGITRNDTDNDPTPFVAVSKCLKRPLMQGSIEYLLMSLPSLGVSVIIQGFRCDSV